MTVLKIVSNRPLAKDVYEMVFEGDTSLIQAPGQFVNIKIDGLYLRRPMSVCDYGDHYLKIIYKVVGEGTKAMKDMVPGQTLDVLLGLGNGFPLPDIHRALLIGGGVGVPPMYNLAKQLKTKGVEVISVLGFNSKEDVFYEEEMAAFGPVHIATMDGSYGFKGNVVELIKEKNIGYDTYFSCGPEKMLDALVQMDDQHGYLSFEARMGCGFGACMGCSCKTKTKPYKRICMEGPVLEASEVIVHE